MVRDAMLDGAERRGHALGRFKFPRVALAVGERERVGLVALGFGDGQHGGGVEAAAEQNDGAFCFRYEPSLQVSPLPMSIDGAIGVLSSM